MSAKGDIVSFLIQPIAPHMDVKRECRTVIECDVVFLIGFDQGKLPAKDVAVDSEIYQMLVALTRARKRIYLINTIGQKLSKFIDYIDSECYEEI